MHPKMLLDGLAYVESPRWHEDRLWFAHWGTEEIVAVDLDGKSEVVGRGAPGLGWCTHTGRAADPAGECVRVFEGGEIRERIVLDRAGFACALGGPDRRTLFMLAAEWEGAGNVDEVIARRTGQVLVADAPAPGVGWP